MTVIEMRSVHKHFGDVKALDGVDLVVERGELVAVLGPNGSGKTTMFELALGLATPTSGEVTTLGGKPGTHATALRTGVMLQSAGLPENLTVVELLRLVAASYSRSLGVDEALRRVGLDTKRGRKVSVLSGGERQRLLLAMAIVGVPDLLVLDEPTAAMDAEARRAFWNEATSATDEGTTLVFATHDLAEAEAVASRIVVLDEGRVAADATPAELRELSPKTVHFRSTASISDLMILLGTDAVVVDAGSGRIQVHTSAPELVVAALVKRGYPVEDLLIADAGLEKAVLALVGTKDQS
jgi:ABC-2 type transport system ATP-binding protein